MRREEFEKAYRQVYNETPVWCRHDSRYNTDKQDAVYAIWQAAQQDQSQPSELEMHRADYNAIKKAGFESPGELLAAWQAAKAEQQESERVVYRGQRSGGSVAVEPVAWNHFSLDTMPPPNTPLLVKFKGFIGTYAAMFHITPHNEDFDFWFSAVSHENANLESPDVYDATNHECEQWRLLYTYPVPAQPQPTQQLLDTLQSMRVEAWYDSDVGTITVDASDYGSFVYYDTVVALLTSSQEQEKGE